MNLKRMRIQMTGTSALSAGRKHCVSIQWFSGFVH